MPGAQVMCDSLSDPQTVSQEKLLQTSYPPPRLMITHSTWHQPENLSSLENRDDNMDHQSRTGRGREKATGLVK